MIPDRYRAALDVLDEVAKLPTFDSPAAREAVGTMALAIASFIVDTTTSDELPLVARITSTGELPLDPIGLPDAPGLRIDFLAHRLRELDARISTLELAITETNRRLPADAPLPPATKTIFSIPVVLAEGITDARIQHEIRALPPGLSGEDVVARLVELELVERAR